LGSQKIYIFQRCTWKGRRKGGGGNRTLPFGGSALGRDTIKKKRKGFPGGQEQTRRKDGDLGTTNRYKDI